jgi:hypothetical protein
MENATGISHSAVGRIWRTFRLQPHRTDDLNRKGESARGNSLAVSTLGY